MTDIFTFNLEALPWVIFGGISIAAFIFLFFPRSVLTLDQDLQEVESGRSGLLRIASPFLKTLSDITVSWRGKRIEAYREWLSRRIVMANLENQIETEEFLALHLFDCIVGLLLGALLGIMFSLKMAILGALVLAPVGLWFPYAWIDGLVKKRHIKIFRSLPYTLDLLTVSVESGLDFLGGLQRVSKETKKGPLRDEVTRMLQQMQLGKTRVEVLRQMSERVNLTELTSVISALVQATTLGTSLGPTLRLQSDMMRVKRSQIAEKKANEAPVKMLFPLLLFIFPSIFIIILGPVILQGIKQFQ
jgi:tight adherence protein C